MQNYTICVLLQIFLVIQFGVVGLEITTRRHSLAIFTKLNIVTCNLFLSINNLSQSLYAKHAQRIDHQK